MPAFSTTISQAPAERDCEGILVSNKTAVVGLTFLAPRASRICRNTLYVDVKSYAEKSLNVHMYM